MASYQASFDDAFSEASRLVVNHGSEIRDIIPNFFGSDFDRISKSISRLLEKVDKSGVDHPEYLAHSRGNIANYSVELMEGVPSSIESGAAHFVQTTLPALLLCEERLFKAVGNHYYQVREVKDRQVREIQKLAEEAIEFRDGALEARTGSQKAKSDADGALASLSAAKVVADASLSHIQDIKNQLEKLASGDGRGKSLEALKRTADQKLEAIERVLANAEKASKSASSSVSELEGAQAAFKSIQGEIDTLKKEATSVLSLSNQAGLARSYLKESSKLATKSYIFTSILYATAIATAFIAAFYVLPTLEHNIGANGKSAMADALPFTLLRATVLAPLVYVLYFTTRQVSSLETLRMDYAEKAAASLAYSGYKDEMSEDVSLLERLRGSLLLKFAEHPERLLRKQPVTDRIEVEAPGFKASSTSAEASTQRDQKEDG